MKRLVILAAFHAVLFSAPIPISAQGTFQNLDFESPVLPLIHVGLDFDFVVSSNAAPGWTFYLGTNQQTRLLYNNYFLGTATAGLLGPGLTNSFPRIIDGAYTITLQAGVQPQVPVDPPLLDAAMIQEGLVPVAARSLQLKAYSINGGQFAVYIGGQLLTVVPMHTTPTYTLYGADITPYAGLNTELRIAAIRTPTFFFSAFAFDSIVFSEKQVPEPSSLGVLALGALLLAGRLLRKART